MHLPLQSDGGAAGALLNSQTAPQYIISVSVATSCHLMCVYVYVTALDCDWLPPPRSSTRTHFLVLCKRLSAQPRCMLGLWPMGMNPHPVRMQGDD